MKFKFEILTYRRAWALPLEIAWHSTAIYVHVLCFEFAFRYVPRSYTWEPR